MATDKKMTGLLLISFFGLFWYFTKKPKYKTDIIIDPDLPPGNLFANKGAGLYDQYFTDLIYTFLGHEYLVLLDDDGDNYYVSYIRPNGKEIRGFIDKRDTKKI